MSGYQSKEFSEIQRAVISPLTAAFLSTRLPSPAEVAVKLAKAPPEHRTIIPREIHELRLAAAAYGANKAPRVPVASIPDPWVNTREAAAALGCDRKTIVNLAKAGKLEGRQPGKLWWVSRDSLESLMVSRNTSKAA